MTLSSKIEAILFALAQPVTLKKLAELCEVKGEEIDGALRELAERLKEREGGIQLMIHGSEAELVTRPEVAELVREALKEEAQGELTRPSLEALAILAYRGPLTRPELEQIRGVQSTMILRNLAIRGLVEMKEDTRLGQPVYAVTSDFLKAIGADRVESLPHFDHLRAHSSVEQILDELNGGGRSTEGSVEI